MWVEIMKTNAGREFEKWLAKEQNIEYKLRALYDFSENGKAIEEIGVFSLLGEHTVNRRQEIDLKETIVNNLAVQFLDNEGYILYTPYRCLQAKNFRVCIINKHKRSEHNSKFYLKNIDLKKYYTTRQKALQAGLKEAFKLCS